MLGKLVGRRIALFSKITPLVLPQLQKTLEQTRSISSLGEYLTQENAAPLLELVINARLTLPEANSALDGLSELCSTGNEEEINLIVNILKQKGINFSRMGDLPSAISHFEQAISTVLLIDNHNELLLSQMHKFIADLCIQVNELKKARLSLEEAKSIIERLSREETIDQAIQGSALASIHTQMCMISYRQQKPIQALALLERAIHFWDKAPRKILQQYELTIRLKCMLHLLFKESAEAVRTARQFLHFMEESREFKSRRSDRPFVPMRLYFMNIVCLVEQNQEWEAEVVQMLRKVKEERGPDKLQELKLMLGIPNDRYTL